MNHMDAERAEVVVMLDELGDEDFQKLLKELEGLGMEVYKVDRDEDLIDGSVDLSRLEDLKRVPHVRYVRNVLTYTVDYPAGDPRDKDGPDDDGDD